MKSVCILVAAFLMLASLPANATVFPYQTLKRELAAKFPHDKSKYQAAKAPFIRTVLAGLP